MQPNECQTSDSYDSSTLLCPDAPDNLTLSYLREADFSKIIDEICLNKLTYIRNAFYICKHVLLLHALTVAFRFGGGAPSPKGVSQH